VLQRTPHSDVNKSSNSSYSARSNGNNRNSASNRDSLYRGRKDNPCLRCQVVVNNSNSSYSSNSYSASSSRNRNAVSNNSNNSNSYSASNRDSLYRGRKDNPCLRCQVVVNNSNSSNSSNRSNRYSSNSYSASSSRNRNAVSNNSSNSNNSNSYSASSSRNRNAVSNNSSNSNNNSNNSNSNNSNSYSASSSNQVGHNKELAAVLGSRLVHVEKNGRRICPISFRSQSVVQNADESHARLFLLVVDEASMVDVMLMQALLKALPDKAALLAFTV
jgi:hypothetical protein